MALRTGIVGLPNVGKSSLFNALSSAGALAANYPFATVDPNVARVPVPDPRLNVLAGIEGSLDIVPTTLDLVDIAGLVRGASRGEGLGNQFLGHIRSVDAILHVLRCFGDSDVVHVEGGIDPVRDFELIETELQLADLEVVERRIEKSRRQAKSGDKAMIAEVAQLETLAAALQQGESLRRLTAEQTELEPLSRELGLLTAKPMVLIANVDEDAVGEGDAAVPSGLPDLAQSLGVEVIPVSARVESEIAGLDPEERGEFLEALGLAERGLDRVIRAGYRLLDLRTYFTVGEKEARAWTVPAGTAAPQAAGVIHSDFERGFIRAEVVAYDDFVACRGWAGARDAGKLRSEGRDYIVQEGDVCLFRFNV
ncbi:MAG: redox-regulated ATPase YchF [Candidatus Dadabacteria bacterium]|nr:MAG: redox-regulated ATPase YchF [Candidatus Dadabacteria bacterium]